MRQTLYLILAIFATCLASCSREKTPTEQQEEDTVAKRELQGVWVNEDGEDAAFRIKGDSVYFPDSTSAPTYFRVERDSFVLQGANVVKYPIAKRTPHLFVFVNQAGERVRLVKSDDASYLEQFEQRKTIVQVNQQRTIKRDSIVYHGAQKYHSYVQVNPTTYKVVVPSYSDEGVEVDNIYYDNIIHVSLFADDRRIYSSNLDKKDFAQYVPQQFLTQSVFSDLQLTKADEEGVHYFAVLAVPNSSTSFMVEVVIAYDGHLSKRVAE